MRYPKEYTVKEWKRFDRVAERENGNDITFQEILCKQYDIVLTDYKTKKERILNMLPNPSNINDKITKFNKYVDQFSKVIAAKPSNGRRVDYSPLVSKPRKRKGNTISFFGEDHPTRKRRNRKVKPKEQISFFGKKKVKFF